MVIETIECYENCNSSVYLFDASKAFDRLCHHNLFDFLLYKDVGSLVLLYTRALMKVNDSCSDLYPLLNGVKQGAVQYCSPFIWMVF